MRTALEQEEKQFEAAEQAARKKKWFQYAEIPRIFMGAKIDNCADEIQRWADRPQSDLVIEGDVGRGKTYAACAALLTFCPEKYCKFKSFSGIYRDIQTAYETGASSEKDIISHFVNVGILCIDDFGKRTPTDWGLSILWDIIDNRINNQKPTIITSQYSSKRLVDRLVTPNDTETGLAIVSRLSPATHVFLHGADRRLASGN